ncbi:hypothetical protein B0H16DRAFT_1628565, partial [Mycena metata]
FRTYFPEAYRTHYVNTRAHLLPSASSPSPSTSINSPASSKPNRSTHPDGTPLFPLPSPAHRKRRAFTPEEDAALLEGFRRHGAAMDLHDRFRNMWPGEYERAGYKAKASPRGATRHSSTNGSMPPSVVGSEDEGDGGGGAVSDFGAIDTSGFSCNVIPSKGEETALVRAMRHLDIAPDQAIPNARGATLNEQIPRDWFSANQRLDPVRLIFAYPRRHRDPQVPAGC